MSELQTTDRLSVAATWAIRGFLAYFLVKVLYIALTVPHEIPPDETVHLQHIQFMADGFLFPDTDEAENAFSAQLVPRTPNLYYWVCGKLLQLNVVGIPEIPLLRLLSVGFALLGLWAALNWIRLISENRVVHALFIGLLTNTLMFVFMSAVINNDSMSFAIIAGATLYFTRFVQLRGPTDFARLCLLLMLGTLTKQTLMPVGAVLAIAAAILGRDALMPIVGTLRSPGSWTQSARVYAVAAGILFALNLSLYGVNLVRYGAMVPAPRAIMDFDVFMTDDVNARNYILLEYHRGNLPFPDAVRMTERIDEPGVKNDTVGILAYHERAKQEGKTVRQLSRIEYSSFWFEIMIQRLHGFLGHAMKVHAGWVNWTFAGLYIVSIVMLVPLVRRGALTPGEIALMIAVVVHVLVLMQVVNYRAYLNYRIPGMAVQGRYLFPAIIPIYGLMARSLLESVSVRVQAGIAAGVLLFFVLSEFPFYLGFSLSGWE